MSTISMPSEIIRGRATSCYFLGQTIGSARGRCGAAIDWVGFFATIIERRRDVARPVQYFDPTAWPDALTIKVSYLTSRAWQYLPSVDWEDAASGDSAID